jgi:hypothetical protein
MSPPFTISTIQSSVWLKHLSWPLKLISVLYQTPFDSTNRGCVFHKVLLKPKQHLSPSLQSSVLIEV